MLSFTMQVPCVSTASQGMIIPFAGIMMTSPGTRSVDMASSISRNNVKTEVVEMRHTRESRRSARDP